MPTGDNQRRNTEETFWALVKKTPSCWEFTGNIHSDGYGFYCFQKKRMLTHRLSYIFAHGSIPDGLCVLHKCDNRPCVKPAHLWLGTRTDNNRDMVQKKRNRGASGEQHPSAKLKKQQVTEIRDLFSAGVASQGKIAQLYGVRQCHISRIVHGTSWK